MIFSTIIAFIGPMAHAASNVVDSFIAGSLFKRVTTIIFYQSITNFLALPFLFFFGNPQMISWQILPAILTISAIEIFYLIPYFLALKRMDTSIIAALFSLGKVFLPFIAFFMIGEALNPSQYVGFAIIVLSNLILNVQKSNRKIKIDFAFWLMFFVSIILCYAAVLEKKVLFELDWITVAFWTIIFSDLFTLTFLIPAKSRKDIVDSFGSFYKNIKYFLLIELLDRIGVLINIYVLSVMPVLVSKAIGSTQPIFALLYGVVLTHLFGNKFKENMSRKDIIKKVVCFILISIGIILTTIGNYY